MLDAIKSKHEGNLEEKLVYFTPFTFGVYRVLNKLCLRKLLMSTHYIDHNCTSIESQFEQGSLAHSGIVSCYVVSKTTVLVLFVIIIQATITFLIS